MMNVLRKWKRWILGLLFPTALAAGVVGVDQRIDPYTEKQDRFEMALVETLPESGEAKVELLKNEPKAVFSKWDGEAQMGVKYANVQAQGERAFFTDRVEWKGPKEEVHAYPLEAKAGMEDGGFEIEIYLKEKPDTNMFDFTIDGADSLDFFYQPELIAEGASRPENVVGSYAVYHSSKKDHQQGGMNYATGKAYHIYRPKAIDVDGNEQWAELSYDDNGTLSVTVPQIFLDTAVYPVTVDPTFGYTSAGATPGEVADESMLGSIFGLYENGTVSQLTFYSGSDDGVQNYKGVLVQGSNKNIVSNGIGGAVSIGSTFAWRSSTFATPPSVTPQNYILFVIADTGGDVTYLNFDTGTTNQGYSDTTNSYASPTNPTDATNNNNKYSIYATYTCSTGQPCFDAQTTLQGTSTTTTSVSHTVGTATNGVLVVAVNAKDVTVGDRNVSGVTCAGSSITKEAEVDDGNNTNTELWYIVNSTTGAVRCTVTFGGTVSNAVMSVRSYTNVDQADPVEASNAVSGSGVSAVTTNVTTVNASARVIDAITINKNNCTPGTLQNTDYALTATAYAGCGSDLGVIATASTTSMKHSWTGGNTNYTHVLAALKAFVAAAGGGVKKQHIPDEGWWESSLNHPNREPYDRKEKFSHRRASKTMLA